MKRNQADYDLDIAMQFAGLRPQGGFRVVLADPPWEYKTWSEKGLTKAPQTHYQCMDLEWIKRLPVKCLAHKNCALFMWVTWPMMTIWNDVIRAWGFNYSGLAWEWVKFNRETGKFAFGGGYGTRKNLEPCLLATCGDPSLQDDVDLGMFGCVEKPDGVRSVRDFIEFVPTDAIYSKRREHSRKPDEQYHRIETLFQGPYIELFPRQHREGWSAWGNEIGKFEEAS